MLKRLLRPLLEPIAAKLDKLLDRTSEGFKKQQQRNSEERQKQRERMNMLSRQVDDSRDEIIRGFARQEAKLAAMKKQLDQILVRMTKLGAMPGGRPAGMAGSVPSATEAAVPSSPIARAQGFADSEVNPMTEMMVNAGSAWLEAEVEATEKSSLPAQ